MIVPTPIMKEAHKAEAITNKNGCICRSTTLKNNGQDTGSISNGFESLAGQIEERTMMNRPMKNANAQRVTINDVTNGSTMTTDAVTDAHSLNHSWKIQPSHMPSPAPRRVQVLSK